MAGASTSVMAIGVLAELIDAAHARGLEAHAWYGIAPTWHGVFEGLPSLLGG